METIKTQGKWHGVGRVCCAHTVLPSEQNKNKKIQWKMFKRHSRCRRLIQRKRRYLSIATNRYIYRNIILFLFFFSLMFRNENLPELAKERRNARLLILTQKCLNSTKNVCRQRKYLPNLSRKTWLHALNLSLFIGLLNFIISEFLATAFKIANSHFDSHFRANSTRRLNFLIPDEIMKRKH